MKFPAFWVHFAWGGSVLGISSSYLVHIAPVRDHDEDFFLIIRHQAQIPWTGIAT